MPARRKSNVVKLMAGTARKDRAPRRDFAARLARAPAPPARLPEPAQRVWRRLAPAAVNIGTLTSADLAAFELLAVTLAAEAEAREAIQREGMTVATGAGGRKPHPAVRMAETARAQAARLLADFGLTPKGRQSLDPPKPPPSAVARYLD